MVGHTRMCIDQHLNTRASDEAKMAFIDSGSELEARALEFVKYAEKQLEAAEKQLEKLGKEAQANPVASPPAQYYLPAMVLAQAHEEELRKKMDEIKPWLTFDQDLMRKLNLIKKGQI